LRIILVCKSGGDFDQSHVDRLTKQVGQATVLDDTTLEHGWPGWWSKMEIFRIPGPALYMDLDTVVLGDLSPLLEAAQTRKFIAMRDPYPHQRELMSSVMAWSGDMSHLYETFKQDPERYMSEYTVPRWWGDQGFIEYHQQERDYWQDILPGMVRSYKKECLSGVPDGTRLLVFHGKPRPWEAGY